MRIQQLYILLLLSLSGCCSNPPDRAIMEFRQENPVEFKKYVYLYPGTLDMYLAIAGSQDGIISTTLDGVSNRFGNVNGITNYLSKTRSTETQFMQNLKADFTEFDALSKNGATICQFRRKDEKTDEIGLLALKDGNIVKKDVWLTQYLNESPGDFTKSFDGETNRP